MPPCYKQSGTQLWEADISTQTLKQTYPQHIAYNKGNKLWVGLCFNNYFEPHMHLTILQQ